ncbi:MAG: multicomponent Na+:H+ antiporter subunit E [Myxococcota bacterium]|jgi:multicomponent Na+:H+ antiporter subunit E
MIRLALFFLWELALSSARVAHDVLTPTRYMRPALIVVPLSVDDAARITVVANLVSLTPGSLTIDASLQRRELLVHTMFLDGTAAEAAAAIQSGFEAKVISATRWRRP